LGHWPVWAFQTVVPPPPPAAPAPLQKEDKVLAEVCEAAPVIWKGRLVVMECLRPASGGTAEDYSLVLRDAATGEQLCRFGTGYSLASAYVHKGLLCVFASRFAPTSWNDVTLFKSRDLQHWQSKKVIQQEAEHLFNSSVCAGRHGFVMAYESDDPKYPAFTIKFATSPDLENWTKLPDVFGADRYTACPCLRYAGGHYYLLYLEHRQPRWFFETWLARSKDLKTWELAPANPLLAPGPDEGINASDPDLVEFEGRTLVYYSVGDQRTWSRLKRAVYPGPMRKLFEAFFQVGR
jgi:hypothetical protein